MTIYPTDQNHTESEPAQKSTIKNMNPETVSNAYSFLCQGDKSKIRSEQTLSNTGSAPKYSISGQISNETLISLNIIVYVY